MRKAVWLLLLVMALIFALGAERMENPRITPLLAVTFSLLLGLHLADLNPLEKLKSTLLILFISLSLAYLVSAVLGVFAALILPTTLETFSREKIEDKEAKQGELEKQPGLPFEREIPSLILIRASPLEVEEATARLAIYLVRSLYKLIIIDRSGMASELLEEEGIPFRIAKPDEIELLYPGKLGDSFPVMLAGLLSNLTGAVPSVVIAAASRGRWEILLKDQTTPESLRLAIKQIAGPERFLIQDLLPKLGPLIVDLSNLESEFSRELATLLVLLQIHALNYRDFVVVASLFRSLQKEVLRGENKDLMLQLLGSLSSGGALIGTTYEVDPSIVGCFSSIILLHPTNLAANKSLSDVLKSMDRKILGEIHKLSEKEGLFISGRPILIKRFRIDDVK
ncbi:MAG: hypothetical protein DRN90_03225 [Thermoproteota archaeon]|nr:MAG: hypothetical protein DRN90_03225 [Candidatus Korarchaeota archaeon]